MKAWKNIPQKCCQKSAVPAAGKGYMMANLNTHPLVRAAYDVCQLIESCGASEALTRAVSAASALLDPIEELAKERDRLKAENEQLTALLTTASIIEIAVRNVNVASYMEHWEKRTERAEAQLAQHHADLEAAVRWALALGHRGRFVIQDNGVGHYETDDAAVARFWAEREKERP
jgi:hypothetical protein